MHLPGLTTGRVSVSGHGITAPPARDLANRGAGDAAAGAGVVVLAVPGGAVAEVVAALGAAWRARS